MATRLTRKRKRRLIWQEGDVALLRKRFPVAKSPMRKSLETLRNELQKLFPENRVVIEKEV